MSSISRLQQEELAYNRMRAESGSKLLMRPEQQNSAWIKYIVPMSTKPGNLVVGVCAGIYSVTKARMFHP